MPTYKILGADGQEYGPVNAEVLRQWIAQRRANATTSVRTEGGGDWKPLSSFPEFAEALAAGPPASPALPPPGPVRTSRLAIASLVCGILGFLCLPALASVVLGIMALVRINKSQGQLRGQGLAIAGLCVSGVMLVVMVPAAMLLPALSKAQGKAMRIRCVNNLKQIGLGARMYSNDNKEIFPPDFLTMSNELNSPKILVCPADSKHTAVSTWAEFDPRKNLTYEYLKPGITEKTAMSEVIFRCPIHNNIGLGDGSVIQRPMTSAAGQFRAPR
jgi:hypothetical protein